MKNEIKLPSKQLSKTISEEIVTKFFNGIYNFNLHFLWGQTRTL